ncbi:porin [Ideonella livida]|uniref:Porin n=1 Tax=Ideonella livida TaxID=2707176 RepID=A0A7C9PGT5_9BURK|nr:porin [Ideonella livida]NDY91577.1 porin [Ideonella livida]
MKHRLALTALAAAATLATLPAQAADFKAGDWTLSLGGIVNAYYTSSSCSGDAVGGLALGGRALGCGGADKSTTIGNGLLPNVISVGAKTTQDGYDIGATLIIGSAVSSDSSIANNSNVDVRQGFLTFGNASMGTVKLGRDYGLFGANAILGDMTLLGAGATVNATQANRVTLGHIGAGYSFLGMYGQMAYTTPALGDFSLTAALVSPVDAYANASAVAGKTPQVQVQGTLKLGNAGKAWLGVKQQKFEGAGGADGFTMNGTEVGVSYTVGGLGLLANLQQGKGLGLLADGDNGDGKGSHTLLQATWQATAATKLGLSHGQSKLKDQVGSNVETNTATTLGVYHGLTKSLTLVGESTRTVSKAADGSEARMNGLALGGILFF